MNEIINSILGLFNQDDLRDAFLIFILGSARADGFLSNILDGLLGEILYSNFLIPNGSDIFGTLGSLSF